MYLQMKIFFQFVAYHFILLRVCFRDQISMAFMHYYLSIYFFLGHYFDITFQKSLHNLRLLTEAL
jgi:hypothetical protein